MPKYLLDFLPVLLPVVLSEFGPVFLDGVVPCCKVQSKLSTFCSWKNPHILLSVILDRTSGDPKLSVESLGTELLGCLEPLRLFSKSQTEKEQYFSDKQVEQKKNVFFHINKKN